MRVLEINICCGCLSTGRIASDIAKDYINNGDETVVAYARGYVDTGIPTVQIGGKLGVYAHKALSLLFDDAGFHSKHATRKFLEWADDFNPDVLWIHNIHGYYINVEMLFAWIKSRPQMNVKWTLHDCWSFTGHCPYFSVAKCDKWRTLCHHCPIKGGYPKSILFDNSKSNYIRKKIAFTGVKNMVLVTPSQWLKDLVQQSFLREYPVEVHYNEVDTSVFQPTPSHFRQEYGLEEKKIVLGVASTWSRNKGLADFEKLAAMLDDSYKIVLVGLSKKQIAALPKCILGLERTHNAIDLAKIYSAADVFVNPSKEETFGMTTVEAISCGTKAVVYKDTACEEVVALYGGVAVEQHPLDLKKAIEAMLGEGR